MKFYQSGRSIFSQVNNITESLEKCLDKVVSRGEKNFSVHKKYMNFLTHRKTALDDYLYKLSVGRSMVEMLGVLAIIGVLSVGAIAGYSKAMMKYKLNKHIYAYNMLFNNAINISSSLPQPSSSTVTGQNTILKKLQLIPDGITFINKHSTYGSSTENAHLRDIFNNELSFYSRAGFGYTWGITAAILNSPYSFDICYNLIYVAKEYSPQILWLLREDRSTNSYIANYLYGDTQCAKGKRPCLKNLELSDIAKICRTETEKNSQGVYFFSINW